MHRHHLAYIHQKIARAVRIDDFPESFFPTKAVKSSKLTDFSFS
jgi:hypothetical protein